MGKSKGKAQISGFSGRTVGKMIQGGGGHGGNAPKPGPKKKK